MLPLPRNNQPPSATESYAFTIPDPRAVPRKRRYQASPGCPLCSILVNLETSASASGSASTQPPTPAPAETNLHVPPSPLVPQPPSPAFPSPAVLQKPLLPPSSFYAPGSSTRTTGGGSDEERMLLVDDDELTGWLANRSERLARNARHVVLAFKRHVQDVYDFGPQDIPLLSHALQTAHLLLDRTPSAIQKGKGKAVDHEADAGRNLDSAQFDGFGEGERRVGFVTGITRDPQFPYAHLHIHATLGPLDSASWYRRTVTYSSWSPGWWGLEDLIAEIRETTSNNRVKSGYGRRNAPITAVPLAGSDTGLPNALEPSTANSSHALPKPHATNPPSPAENAVSAGSGSSSSHRNQQQIQIQTQATSDDQTLPSGLLDAVLRDAERKLGAVSLSSVATKAGTEDGRNQQSSDSRKGKGKQKKLPMLKLEQGSTDQNNEASAAVGLDGTRGGGTAVPEVHE
ncbi:hypothetical protein QFC21_001461 [Naganishia friedmannii]|uniref:Uncharacterized protein n=1 Tax=Naganishia friedmannii TaxID=89922 RepID=A0ACC2W632_9TREE|nr:hypothetical protein QFC21_001461 [Naganishia friedmannii]